MRSLKEVTKELEKWIKIKTDKWKLIYSQYDDKTIYSSIILCYYAKEQLEKKNYTEAKRIFNNKRNELIDEYKEYDKKIKEDRMLLSRIWSYEYKYEIWNDIRFYNWLLNLDEFNITKYYY